MEVDRTDDHTFPVEIDDVVEENADQIDEVKWRRIQRMGTRNFHMTTYDQICQVTRWNLHLCESGQRKLDVVLSELIEEAATYFRNVHFSSASGLVSLPDTDRARKSTRLKPKIEPSQKTLQEADIKNLAI